MNFVPPPGREDHSIDCASTFQAIRVCLHFVHQGSHYTPYTLGIMNFVPPPGGEQQIADLPTPGGRPSPIHFHFTE